jgi:hypothetical protein
MCSLPDDKNRDSLWNTTKKDISGDEIDQFGGKVRHKESLSQINAPDHPARFYN